MPGQIHMTNDCVFLLRAAKRKAALAAAEATKVLTGLNTQPGKLIIDVYIYFNDCRQCHQLTQKVKPNPKIQSGVKIADVPALVDSGANTVAPVLLGVRFLRSVLPENCIQPFFDKVTRSMSGADGKGSWLG